ncbi:MAG: oligosaccharide flippase family protein [Oscillospiraceae bacterium]|nr:oligosaccharide flippase family protein [Oscillospiraceae bacterium]
MKILKWNREQIDVAFSFVSNIFVLALSLVLGLVLPKFISMETYSQYKTYILYSGFVGFFHFGFINGIYLKYGNYNYDELPKETFRKYSWFLIFSQLLLSVLMILLSLTIKKEAFISPIFFVILNIPLINVNCYFNLINQFTKRFRLDAAVQLFQNIIMLIGIMLLIFFKSDNFIHYLKVITLANFAAFLVLVYKCRDIVFGKSQNKAPDLRDISEKVSHGFFIMISEYMGLVVVGIDSIIVNLFLSAAEFSIYSFAVSVVNVLFMLTGTVSKFIFPYLKRKERTAYPELYEQSKIYLIVFSAAISGTTLFMEFFINAFLPKYSESVLIIKLLGITAVFKGAQDLVFGNFFKVLSIERDFAKTNMIAISLAVITDVIAFVIFRSMISVAVASIISFVLWFFISDRILRKKMDIHSHKGNFILICAVAAYFICASMSTAPGVILYYFIMILLALYGFFVQKKSTE